MRTTKRLSWSPVLLPCLLLSLLLPLSSQGQDQDELAPPDVDFFTDLQMTRLDYRDLGADRSQGTRLTLGAWLNELRREDYQFAVESSFNWMGESDDDRSFSTTVPGPDDPIPADIDENTRIDINGLSLGGRVSHEDAIFLRGGLFYYSLNERVRQERTFNPGDPDESSDTLTESDRTSGAAPYLGAGFLMPFGNTGISLIVDYSAYWIESERVDGASLGVTYRMR